MSAGTVIAQRWHRCDPRPSHCAACFRGAELGIEFFTNDSAIDRGVILNDAGTVDASIDDLNLCAILDDQGRVVGGCVFELLEAVSFKPQLHARQLAEIKQHAAELEHWRDTAKRLQGELDRQMAANLGTRKRAA